MGEAEIEAIIHKATATAIASFMASKEQQCRCSVDMGQHKEHHEFISEAIETMKRWNSVRWGVVQAVVVALVIGVGWLVGYGVYHKLGG